MHIAILRNMQNDKYRKKSLLLYDSDIEFANNLKLYFEDIFNVFAVENANNIFERIDSKSIDYLVIEYINDSFDFKQLINSIQKTFPDLKIVLMSTFYISEDLNEKSFLNKIDDYVFKPFDVNLLRQKLLNLSCSKRRYLLKDT